MMATDPQALARELRDLADDLRPPHSDAMRRAAGALESKLVAEREGMAKALLNVEYKEEPWHDLYEDERQDYLKAADCILAFGAIRRARPLPTREEMIECAKAVQRQIASSLAGDPAEMMADAALALLGVKGEGEAAAEEAGNGN